MDGSLMKTLDYNQQTAICCRKAVMKRREERDERVTVFCETESLRLDISNGDCGEF